MYSAPEVTKQTREVRWPLSTVPPPVSLTVGGSAVTKEVTSVLHQTKSKSVECEWKPDIYLLILQIIIES